MTGIFNPWKIVRGQFRTLRDFATGEPNVPDIAFFLAVPFVLSGTLMSFDLVLTEGKASILLTSISIFAGLLFNLLLLVFDVVTKREDRSSVAPEGENGEAGETEAMRREFLRQVFTNISFAIFVSVGVVILLMLWLLLSADQIRVLGSTLSALVYYLLTLFLLTLFMILKRIYVVLVEL